MPRRALPELKVVHCTQPSENFSGVSKFYRASISLPNFPAIYPEKAADSDPDAFRRDHSRVFHDACRAGKPI